MNNNDTASVSSVTIGRGTAVHAAGTYGTRCAETVRPGHAAARMRPAPGPITCKKCRRILGLPVEAPAPKVEQAAAVDVDAARARKEAHAMRLEIARLLKAGDREAALALDAKIPRG